MLHVTNLCGFGSVAETAAAPSFTPADLFGSGEKGGWWDSSDATTLKLVIAGTGSDCTTSDPVGYWDDKSGNGNILVARADDTTRPTYLGTSAGVDFDGSNDALVCTMVSAITSSTLSVVAVISMNSLTVNDVVGISATGSEAPYNSAERTIAIHRNDGSGIRGYRNFTDLSVHAYSSSTVVLVESVYDGSYHTMTIDADDGSPVASTGSFNSDLLAVGDRYASGMFSDVTIYELIIVDRVLNPTMELAPLRSYLNAKWTI